MHKRVRKCVRKRVRKRVCKCVHKRVRRCVCTRVRKRVHKRAQAQAQAQANSLPDEGDKNDGIAEDTVEPDTRFTGDETQTLSLIEKLLARDGISSEFREELEAYKIDISDGKFESSDHHYVHAVYARLTKN